MVSLNTIFWLENANYLLNILWIYFFKKNRECKYGTFEVEE